MQDYQDYCVIGYVAYPKKCGCKDCAGHNTYERIVVDVRAMDKEHAAYTALEYYREYIAEVEELEWRYPPRVGLVEYIKD
jgi:hypothetical protein